MLGLKGNEGAFDRLVRLILAEAFFIGGFFWFSGIVSIVLYVLGMVMLFTALSGFCLIYKLIGFETSNVSAKLNSKAVLGVMVLLFLVVGAAGSYYSDFFTKKTFLEDFNQMNGYYKQTLFLTGQNKREEAVKNYDRLVTEYAVFKNKYSNYQPYAVRSDTQFQTDLNKVEGIVTNLKETIYSGDLQQAHKQLEEIRPTFNEMFKRNGFSMLAIALVDFHDSMEKVLDPANQKNSAGVISTYPDADGKLKAIEEEANDAEIQTIRKNLDDLKKLADDGKPDELPQKAAELKSSFVKVYLQRG
jgi:hypothetical protein